MQFQPVLGLAAEYANQDEELPQYLPNIFHAPSNPDGLELGFDAQTVRGAIAVARRNRRELRSEDEVFDALTTIVTRAVSKALTEHEGGALLAAVLVNNLRNGPDAFTSGTDD